MHDAPQLISLFLQLYILFYEDSLWSLYRLRKFQLDLHEYICFVIVASLDSTAQTRHANGGDWQEEVYQKIKGMKETYLPELNEIYQKIATKLQQHDSLPQQPKSEQLEKLKIFKTMLERIISFLQVSKNNILPGFKEKLGSYEKQIINFINTNRPRKPLQQGQLPQPHIQQPQSQVTLKCSLMKSNEPPNAINEFARVYANNAAEQYVKFAA
ncbi:hypothetical protein GH714_033517 [Hevea brasiliensis]|uniref:Mediator complex subunit 15 KIX domain-containing protein n=1 Tax=Hevea brasiliensis TaxID=3981 RepID=A0A6A6NCH2_HEVBR|nr:hypothetical protein GH714_033517 [Hevea brasiliensis]